MNKPISRYKLKNLYSVAGFSKQAHKCFMDRLEQQEQYAELALNSILEVRKLHPSMGLKKIYNLISPDWIGRDRFIEVGIEYGLAVKSIKNFHRTTFSSKSRWFINLTCDLAIIDINQVWVSDITYYRIGEVFYYITFIEDVYSRRILGYVASPDLKSEANCRALKQAIKVRDNIDLRGLIHHSDRGVQYSSDIYLKILREYEIAVSMCDSVYENTHIERINGIIKNEYLRNLSIKSYDDLVKELKQAVYLYNYERPHWSLDLMTPVQYENEIKSITLNERKIMNIYSEKKNYYVQQSFFS
jgi:putative transposase